MEGIAILIIGLERFTYVKNLLAGDFLLLK
jgi:hypothetical protein